MKQLSKQKGLASLNTVVTIAILGFFLICGFTMLPMYIDNWTVKSALTAVQSDPAVPTMSKSEIRSLLTKKFNVNMVDAVNAKDVKIERTKDSLIISANYEVRSNLMANIDVVAVFDDNQVVVPVSSD